jgi:molecular chaperone DnaK
MVLSPVSWLVRDDLAAPGRTPVRHDIEVRFARAACHRGERRFPGRRLRDRATEPPDGCGQSLRNSVHTKPRPPVGRIQEDIVRQRTAPGIGNLLGRGERTMPYPVGVDLGATFTAAAACLPGRIEVVPLGTRAAFIPTVAAVTPDGSLALGENAAARTGSDRVARQFTGRVGDDTPLLLGGVSVTAEALAARFVSFVLDAVAARCGGPAPCTAITYPATWGSYRVAALCSALSAEGVGGTVLLSGAQATAQAYADRAPVAAGDLIAVYDLGGSRLDVAVVRRLVSGEFALAGRPEELELGGLDFDELMFEHVRAALGQQWGALDGADPAVLAGVAQLRRACTAAKEALSADTEAWIPVAIPGIDAGSDGAVRLVRAELEEMIQPVVEETAAALLRAIASAGAEPEDLAAVLLTGGSARIPLVTQVISEVLGRPVTVAERPKADTAVGAALAAARRTDVIMDAMAGADSTAETAVATTQVMSCVVPDPAEDEPAPIHRDTSPPARPPSTLLRRPELPVRRRPRWYAPGLFAVVAVGIAALLVGGWIWMANANGPPGADANVKNPVADRTAPPSSAAPVKSAKPGESRSQPDTRSARPSKRPTTTAPGVPTPSSAPVAPPPPSPIRSRTSPPTPQPTPTTQAPPPSRSPSPSPTPTASPASLRWLWPVPSFFWREHP